MEPKTKKAHEWFAAIVKKMPVIEDGALASGAAHEEDTVPAVLTLTTSPIASTKSQESFRGRKPAFA